MATSTPVAVGDYGESIGPARANAPGVILGFYTFNAGTYATGGVNLTLPSPQPGKLIGMVLLNDYDVANDRSYKWNGSLTDPEVEVEVRATAAEVADTTDLSGFSLTALLVFQQ